MLHFVGLASAVSAGQVMGIKRDVAVVKHRLGQAIHLDYEVN